MAQVQLKLFPDKGIIWINPSHVASVVDGKYPPGQSGAENCIVTLATGEKHQVHGTGGMVSGLLNAGERRG